MGCISQYNYVLNNRIVKKVASFSGKLPRSLFLYLVYSTAYNYLAFNELSTWSAGYSLTGEIYGTQIIYMGSQIGLSDYRHSPCTLSGALANLRISPVLVDRRGSVILYYTWNQDDDAASYRIDVQ